MAADGWVYLRADKATVDGAKELAAGALSGEGLHLSKTQVLSRALAVGLDALRADPSKLIPSRGGKKASP